MAQKLYYSIREAATLCGVTEATLRSWEKFYPQLEPYRTAGNTRKYTKEDLELIRQIAFLRGTEGKSRESIKKELQIHINDIHWRTRLYEHLQHLRRELLEMRKALD
ncbi:MAG: MerR family transcriptional regulator [Prevotellaceae bacterium]|jgi:DNA-binding transcriptional MerR regulator|nr:MerR family transcriptional regulator [Prevotellaceae bacterium]